MVNKRVKINRAPVLTLWATIVAERLGHDHAAALTFGKALAGLNAQSKGRRLGIYKEAEGEPEKKPAKAPKPGEQTMVPLLGRSVPAVRTKEGLRAALKGEAIEPASVEKYLSQKFGEHLNDVRAAMEALAKSMPREKLESRAFALYEAFRPKVPEGEKGWGAKGILDLGKIRSLAR
jgi:hypothetical protein